MFDQWTDVWNVVNIPFYFHCNVFPFLNLQGIYYFFCSSFIGNKVWPVDKEFILNGIRFILNSQTVYSQGKGMGRKNGEASWFRSQQATVKVSFQKAL